MRWAPSAALSAIPPALCVDERTRVCLTIIYGFDGAAPVEEALRISAAAFACFCRCRPLCDPWCVQG